MFKIFSPSNIFSLITKITSVLAFLFIVFIVFGLIQSLLISPTDYIQGHSVRIMYVHVPSSWIALACFLVIGFLSILVSFLGGSNFFHVLVGEGGGGSSFFTSSSSG